MKQVTSFERLQLTIANMLNHAALQMSNDNKHVSVKMCF